MTLALHLPSGRGSGRTLAQVSMNDRIRLHQVKVVESFGNIHTDRSAKACKRSSRCMICKVFAQTGGHELWQGNYFLD